MKLVEAFEVMERCALRLETLSPDDDARHEILTFYASAVQVQAASEQVRAAGFQHDSRMPVPDFLAQEVGDGG